VSGVFSTCWEMYGSGAGMFMMSVNMAFTAFSGAADGQKRPGGAALPAVVAVIRHLLSTTWDSGLRSLFRESAAVVLHIIICISCELVL